MIPAVRLALQRNKPLDGVVLRRERFLSFFVFVFFFPASCVAQQRGRCQLMLGPKPVGNLQPSTGIETKMLARKKRHYDHRADTARGPTGDKFLEFLFMTVCPVCRLESTHGVHSSPSSPRDDLS